MDASFIYDNVFITRRAQQHLLSTLRVMHPGMTCTEARRKQ
jgi:hypothetical protein